MIPRLIASVVLALGAASIGHLAFELTSALLDTGPPVVARDGPGHWIRPGETLSEIAVRHGITLETLLATGRNSERFPDPDRVLPDEFVELPLARAGRRSYGGTAR